MEWQSGLHTHTEGKETDREGGRKRCVENDCWNKEVNLDSKLVNIIQ